MHIALLAILIGGGVATAQANYQITKHINPAAIRFEQLDDTEAPAASFVGRGVGLGYTLRLRGSEVAVETPGARPLQIKLVGSSPKTQPHGEDPLSWKSDYFIGSDPRQWRTNVTNFAKVRYRAVYPGVDVVFYGKESGIEFDFVLSPGVGADVIQLELSGVDEITEDVPNGLTLRQGASQTRLLEPSLYQESNGIVKKIRGGYLLENRGAKPTIRFWAGEHDPTLPLVVDPVIAISGYVWWSLGPVAMDAIGNSYVTTFGYWANQCSISKLDRSGYVLFDSSISGVLCTSIAVDLNGGIYVTGAVVAVSTFPTVNALQALFGGRGGGGGLLAGDAFVSKLSADGSRLVYSTYLGGTGDDTGYGIAVDRQGNAYVTGYTNSTNFPVRNAFQSLYAGGRTSSGGCLPICGEDVFVTKLSADGSTLIYSTYLGGSQDEFGQAIAVDLDGNAYVTGSTASQNFPTQIPIQPKFAGGGFGPWGDVFVAKFAADGVLKYSTFLGGKRIDIGEAIAVDDLGNAYVAGRTSSADFPTKHAIQGTPGGVFISKLNPSGSALIYSTSLAGSFDGAASIAVDRAGKAYVTGWTNSTNFPATSDAFQPQYAGGTCIDDDFGITSACNDAFILIMDSSGDSLLYSTYFGGNREDFGTGIAVSSDGNRITVIGHSESANPSERRSPGDGFLILLDSNDSSRALDH